LNPWMPKVQPLKENCSQVFAIISGSTLQLTKSSRFLQA
jgi:hypothetical protein